jgi:formylglycine-generating enzyme required for sulfatase activity
MSGVQNRLWWLVLLGILITPNMGYAVSHDGGASGPTVRIAAGALAPFYEKERPKAIASFRADVYPVTNRQFLAFVKRYPQWRRESVTALLGDRRYLSHWESATTLGTGVNPDAPVTHVSWFAARAYCKSQEGNLPTTDQWEYMAQADERTTNARDSATFKARILKWYGKPSAHPLPSVGSTYKNVWGLYDMHGLVWEWVSDFNNVLLTGESRQDSSIDRQAYCASGSTGAKNPTDYAWFMRRAFRSSLKANYTVGNLGFRCVYND